MERSDDDPVMQTVRVRKIFPDGIVEVIPERFCAEDCGQCPGCQTGKPFAAFDPIGVAPGALVQIRPVRVWYLYLFPVVLFFLGYWLGSVLRWGKLGACMGFAAGCLLAVLYIRRRKCKYTITGYTQNVFVSAKKGDNDLD